MKEKKKIYIEGWGGYKSTRKKFSMELIHGDTNNKYKNIKFATIVSPKD